MLPAPLFASHAHSLLFFIDLSFPFVWSFFSYIFFLHHFISLSVNHLCSFCLTLTHYIGMSLFFIIALSHTHTLFLSHSLTHSLTQILSPRPIGRVSERVCSSLAAPSRPSPRPSPRLWQRPARPAPPSRRQRSRN